MRFEFPECKRCCLCVPLRHGILIFGYLNLLFALLVLTVEVHYLNRRGHGIEGMTEHSMSLYKGTGMYTQVWVPFVLYLIEVIFNGVLIVGAHMKRTRLIRVYYYYGITTTLAAFVTFLVLKFTPDYQYFDLIEISTAFIGFVFQIYLLLLIRAELSKDRYQLERTTYVNHMAETF